MTVAVNTLHKNTPFWHLVLGSPDKCLHSLQDQDGDVIPKSWPFTPGNSEAGSGKQGLSVSSKYLIHFLLTKN